MWLLTAALILATLCGCSSSLEPQAQFRNASRPFSAPAKRCWPLPAGAAPTFPVLSQSASVHGTGGQRRLTVVFQFFTIDVSTARDELSTAMERAGFERVANGSTDQVRFQKAGFGTVLATVAPLPDASADIPVRGTISLDLPHAAIPLASRGTCPRHGRPVGASA